MATHVYILQGYLGLVAVATALGVARRRAGPGDTLWRKFPAFVGLNLLFIAASWLPAAWQSLTVVLAGLGAGLSWEVTHALLPASRWEWVWPAWTAGLVALAGFLAPAAWTPIWLTGMLLLGGLAALTGGSAALGRRMAALAAAGLYIPGCLAAWVWVRLAAGGDFQAVFFYLTVASSDAFAQIAGRLFGRRPLAPRLSPAKTVEGAVGGLLFAALVGAWASPTVGWGLARGAASGALLGLAGCVGDLVESSWKRALGLKDFSALLGAQGGLLDRFDALLFAAPFFFLWLR